MNLPSSARLQLGENFHGYIVRKFLGRGSSGSVYLVRHEVLDTPRALKVLDAHLAANDETAVKRFLREARLATRIRHPNLVLVHDCGHDAERGAYYLVMDYVEGSSLRDVIAFEGRLEPVRAASIVRQVASALQAAQAFRVVHRDIKPENVMIEPNGRVKLLDLGIAKADGLGDSLATRTGSVFGTPAYVSPEQAQCSSDVDLRADIYSLGAVFFEMLTGQSPYAGRNATEVIRQVLSEEAAPDIRDLDTSLPPAFAVLVRRMMAKDRESRLSSYETLIEELARLGAAAPDAEAAATSVAIPSVPGMKTILSGLSNPAATIPDDGSFDIQPEVAFVRRRRRRRLALRTLALVLALALVALAIRLLL